MAPSREFKLTNIRYGAEDIHLFEFTPTDKAPLSPVEPGSHLDVTLANGMVRQYSLLTSLCDENRYTIGVKREVSGRGGSQWLHEKTRVGDKLILSAPRNLFALKESTKPVVLIAGGIGITPIYSMYKHLKAQQRPVELHYWCRSSEQALFYAELATADDVYIYQASTSTGRPTVTNVVAQCSQEADIYGCGPARMVDELESLNQQRITVERFQAASVSATSEGFTVILASSGKEVIVDQGQSILEALLDEGVDVMYSCEQGVCGACEQRVVDGEVLHQDSIASAEEHDEHKRMMICCSISASPRLVLDL